MSQSNARRIVRLRLDANLVFGVKLLVGAGSETLPFNGEEFTSKFVDGANALPGYVAGVLDGRVNAAVSALVVSRRFADKQAAGVRSHTFSWAIRAAATRDIEGYQLTLLSSNAEALLDSLICPETQAEIAGSLACVRRRVLPDAAIVPFPQLVRAGHPTHRRLSAVKPPASCLARVR